MTAKYQPRCTRCKVHLGGDCVSLGSVVYLSEEIDPLRAMPLCVSCAILACFRVGAVGRRPGR